jgi:hypothetical protein
MARVFDVVEYPSEMLDEIVHRFPETGVADLRIGSQVIVRESRAPFSSATGKPWMYSMPGVIPSPRRTSRS